MDEELEEIASHLNLDQMEALRWLVFQVETLWDAVREARRKAEIGLLTNSMTGMREVLRMILEIFDQATKELEEDEEGEEGEEVG